MPDVIDWFEATGEGAKYYAEILKGGTPKGCDRPRKYEIAKVWLPHDAKQREWGTGVTRFDQFREHLGDGAIAIGPKLPIEDGITAGRWLFEQKIRIHARCAEGIKRLKSYRYEWDETKKVFSKKPLHDWTSHTADDWRYLALVVQATEKLMRPEAPAKRVTPKPPSNVEEIFNKHFATVAKRRRY
jgi:hypothetical protein